MKSIITSLVLIAFCAFIYVVCATEQPAQNLVKLPPKQSLPIQINLAEGKLERIYALQLKVSNPERRQALQKAQEAWKKFYEADLEFGAIDMRGGSDQAVFSMQRHLYQINLRIYQLGTDFLAGWVSIPNVEEPATK
jgi:uncharacterized protein YecT (DUF1311 family)